MKDGFYIYAGNHFIEYWQVKDNKVVCNFSTTDDQKTYIEQAEGISHPKIEDDYYLHIATQINEAVFISAKVDFINSINAGAL